MTEQSIVWLLSIAVLGTLVLSFLAYRTAAEALRVAQAGGGGGGVAGGVGALSKSEREKARQLAARANALLLKVVGSSRVDLQACKLEYSIVSPK